MSTTKSTTKTTTTTALPLPPAIAKPLYASVGAGDAALEAVRTIPAAYQAAAKSRQDAFTTQVKELRGTALAQVKELPATVKELRGTALAQVKDIPDFVRTLPAKAGELPEAVTTLQKQATDRVAALQQDATARVGTFREQAVSSYESYAARGEKLVASLRPGTPTPAAPTPKAAVKKPAKGKPGTTVVTPQRPAPASAVVTSLPTEAGDAETIATPIGTVHVPAQPTI